MESIANAVEHVQARTSTVIIAIKNLLFMGFLLSLVQLTLRITGFEKASAF
jgi:hypothetical protein